MNTQEHLLTCVNEESGEIAQIALRLSQATCKALRFGLDDGYPGTDRTNRMDLVREVNDLIGALESLKEAGVDLPGLFDREVIEAKKAKIAKWMVHAQTTGALQTKEESSPTNSYASAGLISGFCVAALSWLLYLIPQEGLTFSVALPTLGSLYGASMVVVFWIGLKRKTSVA